uniref:ATP synthase F0 subunit 8 n=1 Tax=Empoascanara defecta TaxID=3057151 RepID=A0AA51NHA4_9HEMI|nr:ATP synthase F0 subunit 8 [Empoascanara defecta]WMQ52351.1 ATP synthase F0 subunit 8 [Empoascanara defecta]
MPQMSPMWWTFLMIMFLMSFIALMTMMYFEFSKEIKYKTNLNFKKMIWKW